MAKRIAVHTLILHRGGKRVSVKPGQVVDLSDAELEDIRKTNADAVKKIETPETNEVKLPPADTPKAQGGKNSRKHDDKAEAGVAGSGTVTADEL